MIILLQKGQLWSDTLKFISFDFYSSLKAVLEKANLLEKLGEPGQFTLLAPNNEAFSSLEAVSWIPFFKTRVLCKKKWTNVFLHSVFNIYDYTFLCLYTQSRHFDNSKMVNWVNLVQKLTKIQGIMQNLNSWNIEVFVIKSWFFNKNQYFP